MEKSWNFVKYYDKTTSCQKTSCQTHKYPTASFLATSGFQVLIISKCMVYKHAYLNTLLLLHSAFMLNVSKMPLKGEFGGFALNSHGNYIVYHEKSWSCVFEFMWEPWLAGLHLAIPNFLCTSLFFLWQVLWFLTLLTENVHDNWYWCIPWQISEEAVHCWLCSQYKCIMYTLV